MQNTIKNRELEGRLEVDHASVATALGALTGTWGAQVGHRELGTVGNLGGLLSPTKTDTAAVFAFEQIQFTDTLKLRAASRTIWSRVSRRLPGRLPATTDHVR